MITDNFVFNGYNATVIIPDNPNGKWLWKTEFFYAFDQAEVQLCNMGYTRVYYEISNKYGSYNAIRLMHEFHKFVVKKYNLFAKTNLFGFSRGGLYAFNYALFYPEMVEKVYFDAPVLDLKSWPPKGSLEQEQMFAEYSLNSQTLQIFNGVPVSNLDEYFSYKIPTLLIAGNADEIVPLGENGQLMIDYAVNTNQNFKYIVKNGCGHHPHSLEDVQPIIDFIDSK